jgi:hypothetical protein
MDASNLAVGAILTQNINSKCNEPITYASHLLNIVVELYDDEA